MKCSVKVAGYRMRRRDPARHKNELSLVSP